MEWKQTSNYLKKYSAKQTTGANECPWYFLLVASQLVPRDRLDSGVRTSAHVRMEQRAHLAMASVRVHQDGEDFIANCLLSKQVL